MIGDNKFFTQDKIATQLLLGTIIFVFFCHKGKYFQLFFDTNQN